ncbi:MAG TPA: glycosyltransferase family 4 protein [Chthoniobacteraceae bacterium]|jgi:glycosyltransferase involved in cell wall biosynthesis|nr:glycosyltransferase family 4 protein [Chthoniobacteraceae bacterium]
MRILVGSYHFSPDVGGLETASALLATQFAAQGHEVRLVTQTEREDRAAWPFSVIRRPRPRALLQHVRWCQVFFQNNISLHGLWPALLCRKPWIVVHQTWLRDIHGGEGWREGLKRFLIRWAVNVSISEAIAADLHVPSVRIGNPYRSEVFRRRPEEVRDRDLVFLGRLVSDKGLDLLVEALGILRGENLRPRLTVIGAGPEEAAVRGQAQSAGVSGQIDFAGPKSGDKLSRLLNAHRIMVVPSRWAEPFGIVALEGIACGCVVVGSERGGLQEAIGPCGLTFPNGDAAALAAALKRLLTEPQLGPSLLAGRAAHLARFEAATVAREYLQVFADQIG